MSPPISARQSPVWHRPLRYLPGFLIPALATISLLLPGFWAWLTVIVTFGFFPAIELFRAGSPDNLDPAEEAAARQNRGYVILLYAMVPIQYGLLATYLVRIANHQYQDLFTLTGATFAMGIACGVLGINVAHDLGHRRRRSEQALAKALLLTSLYLHFFIEHNRGHHALVGTDEDPASARYGESLFRFLPRTLVGSLISAWQLERDRLAKRGQGPVTWKNQLTRANRGASWRALPAISLPFPSTPMATAIQWPRATRPMAATR